MAKVKAEAAKPKKEAEKVSLSAQILKLMRKGKTYPSRDIVVAMGREPGSKGQTIVNCLKKMADQGLVTKTPDDNGRGYKWTRV